MKLSVLLRWVGPAAIAGGVFLVFSDLSGLPITIPYLSTSSATGYDAVGSAVILFALTLLLVGIAGLYMRGSAPNAAKVIEYEEAYEEGVARSEQPTSEEARHEQAKTAAARPSSRGGAPDLGTGIVLFFLLRQ